MQWLIRLAVASTGVLFAYTALPATFTYGWLISQKLLGRAQACAWKQLLNVYPDSEWLEGRQKYYESQFQILEHDAALDIDAVRTPKRTFWTRTRGERWNGKQLVAYLLAEQEVVAQPNDRNLVQPGEIVLDCGAHVGTFTHFALERGAAKVVAVEPDPVNLECLRRNFRKEIAAGKVIVAPVGVWSSEGTFKLSLGRGNFGMNSLVIDRGGESIDVRTTTIDKLLTELGVGRVDFIKMDIEGAEPDAIRGGRETIARNGPILTVCSYHQQDHLWTIPLMIHEIRPDYRFFLRPHLLEVWDLVCYAVPSSRLEGKSRLT